MRPTVPGGRRYSAPGYGSRQDGYALAGGAAAAQSPGTFDPKLLPPLAHPDRPSTPAKELLARQPVPAAAFYKTASSPLRRMSESNFNDGPLGFLSPISHF